jgi:hypothetical protein
VKRRASPPRGQPSAQSRFHDAVFRRYGASCLMCEHAPVDATVRQAYAKDLEWLQAAHVLPKRWLLGADKACADGGIVLCVYHHGRHDHWVERVPRVLLPPEAVAFADRIGLGWLLDKEYPEVDTVVRRATLRVIQPD